VTVRHSFRSASIIGHNGLMQCLATGRMTMWLVFK